MRKIKLLIVFVFLQLFLNTVSAFTAGMALEIPIYKTFESPKGGGIGFYVHFTPETDSFYNYFIHGLWKLTEEDTATFEINNLIGVKFVDAFEMFPIIGGGTIGLRFIDDKQLFSYGVFLLTESYIGKTEFGSLGFGFRMLNDYFDFYGYEFTFMMTFRVL